MRGFHFNFLGRNLQVYASTVFHCKKSMHLSQLSVIQRLNNHFRVGATVHILREDFLEGLQSVATNVRVFLQQQYCLLFPAAVDSTRVEKSSLRAAAVILGLLCLLLLTGLITLVVTCEYLVSILMKQ